MGNDRLVAGTQDFTKLVAFDVRAQQWSELVSFTAPGYLVNWVHTPDYKSVDYTIGGADPMLSRVRLADRKIETITSLKGLRRGTGPAGNTEISVAPDSSAVFTRDTGTPPRAATMVLPGGTAAGDAGTCIDRERAFSNPASALPNFLSPHPPTRSVRSA